MAEGYCDTRNSRITLIPFEQRQTTEIISEGNNAFIWFSCRTLITEVWNVLQESTIRYVSNTMFLPLIVRSVQNLSYIMHLSGSRKYFTAHSSIQIVIIFVFLPLRKCLLGPAGAQTENLTNIKPSTDRADHIVSIYLFCLMTVMLSRPDINQLYAEYV